VLPATLNTYLSKPRQNSKNNDLNLGAFVCYYPYFGEGERHRGFFRMFLLFLEQNAALHTVAEPAVRAAVKIGVLTKRCDNSLFLRS